jgi:anti-sigma regulatory factor (Ser/Thr protein kinase)
MKKDSITTEFMDKAIKMKIPRNNQVLDIMRKNITEFLEKNNIDHEISSHIELAVYEAATNIINYTSSEYEQSDIHLQLTLFKDHLEIDIEDYGASFDLTEAEMPNIRDHFNSGQRHGLGIYIIRTLMDEVEYSFNNNTNHLKLKKNLGGNS